MLQDQGGEELKCLPGAAVPRSGLHRCADLLLLLLLFPLLLLLQLSEATACSPSWASSERREPDVLFPVRGEPGGLEGGTSRPSQSQPAQSPGAAARTGGGTGAAPALPRPPSGETTAPRMQGGAGRASAGCCCRPACWEM